MPINKVFYRSPHNYDVELASNEASVKDFGPSLTVQSMAEDVDLNVIMRRFGVTGRMPENLVAPTYGDFSEVFDFRSAQEAIINARHCFQSLPADVRARFGNDPQMFLEFCENRDNLEELRRMGLAVKQGGSNGEGSHKVGVDPGSGKSGEGRAEGEGNSASGGSSGSA